MLGTKVRLRLNEAYYTPETTERKPNTLAIAGTRDILLLSSSDPLFLVYYDHPKDSLRIQWAQESFFIASPVDSHLSFPL